MDQKFNNITKIYTKLNTKLEKIKLQKEAEAQGNVEIYSELLAIGHHLSIFPSIGFSYLYKVYQAWNAEDRYN